MNDGQPVYLPNDPPLKIGEMVRNRYGVAQFEGIVQWIEDELGRTILTVTLSDGTYTQVDDVWAMRA